MAVAMGWETRLAAAYSNVFRVSIHNWRSNVKVTSLGGWKAEAGTHFGVSTRVEQQITNHECSFVLRLGVEF